MFALGNFNMVTEPASAIKREVLQLIDLQIATLQQQSTLNTAQLQDFRTRAERLRRLYGELDRIGRARLGTGLKYARAT